MLHGERVGMRLTRLILQYRGCPSHEITEDPFTAVKLPFSAGELIDP